MTDSADRPVAFGDFVLDPRRAELRHAGTAVPMEPQVFDLICLLVDRAGAVVSRDEIVEAVWDGRIVSDSAIASRINAARKALGDDGNAQRAIRTVRGRGFAFMLDARTVDAPERPAAPATVRPSIIVLPFAVWPADHPQAYFADGIVEDIINGLSRFRDLAVIARSTAFAFRDRAVSARDIAAELGVKYALDGSVRHIDQKVRVSVGLVDADSGRQIWSERYDRELDDIFGVQDDITSRAITAIAPRTSQAEMTSAFSKSITSLGDWDRVMRARWHMDKYTRADTEEALRLLTDAPPTLAIVHSTAAILHTHRMLNTWGDGPDAEIPLAEAAARQAVLLDPQDASALSVLGMIALLNHDLDGCFEHLAEAIALNPNLASAYGFRCTARGCMGQLDETLADFEMAMSLSPRDTTRVFWMSGKGIALYLNRDYAECIANTEKMLKLQAAYGPALRQRAASFAMLGETDAARQAMEALLDAMPGLTVARVRAMIPVSGAENIAHWLDGLRKAGLPEQQ